MEILAPAGNLSILKIAIQAKADAVYISGKSFGARKYADNFTLEEIEEGVKYAHLRDKKVYVTINTLVYDEEFEALDAYLNFLDKIMIDAVIVQDLGVLHFIRTNYPNLTVHASTQMNVHNVEGAQVLLSLGVKRVILARETPIEMVEKIVKTGIEVEVFCHGALCFAYSGQCMMSYYIGKRSGNRGECAQPCRRQYQLKENNVSLGKMGSLLSMKDLNTLDYLDELIKVGVTSLKIEGRMKSAAYVVTALKAYQKKCNHETVTTEDLNNLKICFNREYTKGYLFNETNDLLTNQQSVNNQGMKIGYVSRVTGLGIFLKLTTPINLNDAIRIKGQDEMGCYITNYQLINDEYFIEGNFKVNRSDNVYKTVDGIIVKTSEQLASKENYKIDFTMELIASFNQPIQISLTALGIKIIEKGKVLSEKALKPLTNERILEQLSKTNNPLYNIKNCIINFDGIAHLPISDLNEIRRIALQAWEQQYLIKTKKLNEEYQHLALDSNITNNQKPIIFDIIVTTKSQYEFLKTYHANFKFNLFSSYYDTFNYARHFNLKSYKTTDYQIMHNIDCLVNNANKAILSPAFNIINQKSLDFIDYYDVNTVYLSNELNEEQLLKLNLSYKYNIGIFLYGKTEMMTTRHCLINKNKGYHQTECLECLKNTYNIEDEYHNKMFIKAFCKDSIPEMTIYNFKLINRLPLFKKYCQLGISHFMVQLTDELPGDLEELMNKLSKLKG